MLIFLSISIHEEHLLQPLQTNKKHFKIAITFPTGYNSMFRVTDKIFFSQNQLEVKMVLFKLLFHKVLTKSKVGILKIKR